MKFIRNTLTLIHAGNQTDVTKLYKGFLSTPVLRSTVYRVSRSEISRMMQKRYLFDLCTTEKISYSSMHREGKRESPPTVSHFRAGHTFLHVSVYYKYIRYTPYWHQSPPCPPIVKAVEEPILSPRVSPTLREMIKGLPRTERCMAMALSMLADPQTIEEAFASKQMLTIASDGGLKGTQATFGWVLSKKLKLLCQCSGPVDGHRDTASSTRSELWGLASSLLSLALVSRAWKCTYRCKFDWLVDSKAAIARVRKS
jgi:hypothetical protein